jgi:hypothetical protein
MMKYNMAMRRLAFIWGRCTPPSMTSAVEDEDGGRQNKNMNDKRRSAKHMDDIVTLYKCCV